MSQLTQFDADVAAVETELPVTFRIDGKPYTGQRSALMDRLRMEDAGFEQSFDFILVVRTAAFAPNPPPAVNSDIEIFDSAKGEWVSYNLASASTSQDGVTVEYAVRQSN